MLEPRWLRMPDQTLAPGGKQNLESRMANAPPDPSLGGLGEPSAGGWEIPKIRRGFWKRRQMSDQTLAPGNPWGPTPWNAGRRGGVYPHTGYMEAFRAQGQP